MCSQTRESPSERDSTSLIRLTSRRSGSEAELSKQRFVEVTAFLHTPLDSQVEPASWTLDVGLVDGWRPLYPCILGNVGFLDQFTVTISTIRQATAIEPRDAFDDRFGSPLASPDGVPRLLPLPDDVDPAGMRRSRW